MSNGNFYNQEVMLPFQKFPGLPKNVLLKSMRSGRRNILRLTSFQIRSPSCKKPDTFPLRTLSCRKNCWTEHYYDPQVKAQEVFLRKYKGDKTAEELIGNQRHEALLYSRYKAYYGYVFYIGKKIQ